MSLATVIAVYITASVISTAIVAAVIDWFDPIE